MQQRSDRLLVELPNRLLVIAQELRAAAVVSVQVWVKTGSIYEAAAGGSGAGLSHFLEHLVSGGTTATRSEAQSHVILGSIGARTNASTGLATVRYYINTTAPHVDQAIDLLSDWMQNSIITQAEFSREREVIQREFQMGQGDPGRILWKQTQQARHRYHPARHPTIGYLDEFLRVTRDEIYDFYKRMYVPNNMVFVVVGDIDKRHVVDRISAQWRNAEPRPLPELKFPIESEIDGPRTLSGVADIRKPRLRLAWPGTRLAQPGDYALDLLGVILGQGESSRLVREIRDQQRLVNTINAFNLSMDWAEGFFGIDAEIAAAVTSADDPAIARVTAAILEQVKQVRRNGISAEELARAQRKSKAHVVYGSQTAQQMAANQAGDLVSMHDPDYRQHYAEAVQLITQQDVQDAAHKFLDPNRLITVTLMPLLKGAKPPALQRPQEKPASSDLKFQTVTLDNAAISRGLLAKHRTNGSNIIETDPVRRYVLSNGLRLLVGRHSAVPAVAIQFYQLGGLLADKPGHEGVAHATASMMIKGTHTHSADAIAAQIDNLGASLSVACGYNSLHSQAVCLREDWRTVLELLADVILHPTFKQDPWRKMQPRLLAAIDRLGDRWTTELSTRFRKAYYRDHPWSHTVHGRFDVVEALTVEDLRQFHRQHIGATEAVLAVFGDVDPDQVVRRAEALFAEMPRAPQVPFKPPLVSPPTASLRQTHTKKPMAAVQIGFGPGATRQSPDYPALRVLSNVLSDFPGGWLQQALRGKEGLAYAVWAYPYAGLSPGFFTVVFNTKPQTLAQALDRTMQVAQRGRTDLVDQASLDRAKASVLTSELLSKQSNSDRAQEAALSELYGMELDEPQRFLRQVQQVDPKQLRAMARKYLANPVVVVISHELAPNEQLQDVLSRFPRTVKAQ